MRIAVIGAGQFGRRHMETIRDEPGCELIAVADPAWRGELGFSGYEEMLDKVKPDGAIIATPNALHVPAGLACVARRVPMLVEKPIADTVEASRRLVRAAEAAQVPLLVGHHRRHNPMIEKARDIVQGGGIGRLTAVSALWLLRKPDDYFETAWRREPGGGPLLINLIHDMDDLRFICGEVAEVRAMVSSAARGFDVEDTASIALRFVGGALGSITVSDAVAAPWSWELSSGENPAYPRQHENCYFFCGTQGSLALPRMELWAYGVQKGWYAPLSSEVLELKSEEPLARQLRHFCRVIRGEEAPRTGGEDATRTLAATLAVRQAALSGAPVLLDPGGRTA
jgi:predicted dehydrogenase